MYGMDSKKSLKMIWPTVLINKQIILIDIISGLDGANTEPSLAPMDQFKLKINQSSENIKAIYSYGRHCLYPK